MSFDSFTEASVEPEARGLPRLSYRTLKFETSSGLQAE